MFAHLQAKVALLGSGCYIEKMENGLTLLRRKLPGGRIISIDTNAENSPKDVSKHVKASYYPNYMRFQGDLFKGGYSVAHKDMNNSNNNLDNLLAVDLNQAVKLLQLYPDFLNDRDSGVFLFHDEEKMKSTNKAWIQRDGGVYALNARGAKGLISRGSPTPPARY